MTLYASWNQGDGTTGPNANNAKKYRSAQGVGFARNAASAVVPRSGIVGITSHKVTFTGGRTLAISAGPAVISDGFAGCYNILADAPGTLTVDAGGAGDRTDLIVLRELDSEFGDAGTPRAEWQIVKGTTTADPATPDRCIVLAAILITAGASSISGGSITDRRTFTSTGAVPVPTLAGVAALAEGTLFYSIADQRFGIRTSAAYALMPNDAVGVGQRGWRRTTDYEIPGATGYGLPNLAVHADATRDYGPNVAIVSPANSGRVRVVFGGLYLVKFWANGGSGADYITLDFSTGEAPAAGFDPVGRARIVETVPLAAGSDIIPGIYNDGGTQTFSQFGLTVTRLG